MNVAKQDIILEHRRTFEQTNATNEVIIIVTKINPCTIERDVDVSISSDWLRRDNNSLTFSCIDAVFSLDPMDIGGQ
ncbi:hypothetical protein DERF_003485 [Dermatophagoides farinae]|uniref:Uncharacterized protein n=1 Tax=Dermatophagoides farinae TaxID=6954 RepID=A0A922IH72_DERFA|nr:hypothetical protein DERF_003485 [Dermatophagoides farinae]